MADNPYTVRDLKAGDSIDRTLVLKARHPRTNPQGKSFVLGQVQGKDGILGLICWTLDRQAIDRLAVGSAYRVIGKVESYRDRLQVVATKLEAQKSVDPNDILPSIPEADRETWWKEAVDFIESIAKPPLKELMQAIFIEDPVIREGFRTAPAGLTMHHAYPGGLLEHTVRVTRIAVDLAARYPEDMDRDLLICGALLHDLLKFREMEGAQGSYSTWGNLIGHVVGGAILLENTAALVPDLDPLTLQKLQHLVISHHGKVEYGAPKEPVLIEAIALHHADVLDSQLGAFTQAVAESPEAADWTDTSRMFGRRLYKGP